MKRETIKIDVVEWDLETTRIMTEVLHDIDTDEQRADFAKNVSTMSPRMARVFAQELAARKFKSGLL